MAPKKSGRLDQIQQRRWEAREDRKKEAAAVSNPPRRQQPAPIPLQDPSQVVALLQQLAAAVRGTSAPPVPKFKDREEAIKFLEGTQGFIQDPKQSELLKQAVAQLKTGNTSIQQLAKLLAPLLDPSLLATDQFIRKTVEHDFLLQDKTYGETWQWVQDAWAKDPTTKNNLWYSKTEKAELAKTHLLAAVLSLRNQYSRFLASLKSLAESPLNEKSARVEKDIVFSAYAIARIELIIHSLKGEFPLESAPDHPGYPNGMRLEMFRDTPRHLYDGKDSAELQHVGLDLEQVLALTSSEQEAAKVYSYVNSLKDRYPQPAARHFN